MGGKIYFGNFFVFRALVLKPFDLSCVLGTERHAWWILGVVVGIF